MASDDLTRKQHDVVLPEKDDQSATDQDEDQLAGGEVNTDIDELHQRAFGDEEEKPIDEEIDEDEIARIKGLTKKEQKKSKGKTS